MRFKDVRQHKASALKDISYEVKQDTWGTYIVSVALKDKEIMQNCIPEYQIEKTVEKLIKRIMRDT